jgi:hypothetical protein
MHASIWRLSHADDDERDSVRGGIPTLITETCRITWWKGYVKGRFVALVESEVRAPQLIAESSPIRWRGNDPPEPTDAAVRALDALADRLVSSGWTPGEVSTNAWFGLVFSRPATAMVVAEGTADEPAEEVESSAPQEGNRESPAVTRLRSELLYALDEVERQRRLRAEAEEQAKRAVTSAPATAETEAAVAPQFASELRAVAIALEMTSVVVAAVVFLLVFGSIYAAVVAALTTGAVVLGLDSLFAVRSQRDLSARDATPITFLREPPD